MSSFFLNPSPERVGVICMTAIVSFGIVVIMIGSLIDCLRKRKAARERLSGTSGKDDLEKSIRPGEDVLNDNSWDQTRSTRSGDCLGKAAVYTPRESRFGAYTPGSALQKAKARQISASLPSSAIRAHAPPIPPSHAQMSPLLQAHLRHASSPTTPYPATETHSVYVEGRSANMSAIPVTKLLPLPPPPSPRASKSPPVSRGLMRVDGCSGPKTSGMPRYMRSSPQQAHPGVSPRTPTTKPLSLVPTPPPSAVPDPRVLLQALDQSHTSGKATPPLPLTPWVRNMLTAAPNTSSTSSTPTLTFSSSPPQAKPYSPPAVMSSSPTQPDMKSDTPISTHTSSSRPFKMRPRHQIVASQQSVRRHMPHTPTPVNVVAPSHQLKGKVPEPEVMEKTAPAVNSPTPAPLLSTVRLLHDLSSGKYAVEHGQDHEAQPEVAIESILFPPLQSPTCRTSSSPPSSHLQTQLSFASSSPLSALDSPTLPPPRPLPPVPAAQRHSTITPPFSSSPPPALATRIAQAQAWGRGAGRDDDNGRYNVPRKPLPLRKDTRLVPTLAAVTSTPPTSQADQVISNLVGGGGVARRKDSAASSAITVLEDWDGVEDDITPEDEVKEIGLSGHGVGGRSPIAGLRYPKVPRESAMVWSRGRAVGWG